MGRGLTVTVLGTVFPEIDVLSRELLGRKKTGGEGARGVQMTE